MRPSLVPCFITAAFAVAAAGVASAQTPTPPPAKLDPPVPPGELVTLAQLDRNQDGFVDKSEIPAGHELIAKFAQYDANDDGKLSPEEFDKYANDKR